MYLSLFLTIYMFRAGLGWRSGYGIALLVRKSRVRFPVVSLGIFSVAPPDATMCLGVNSAPENEYQGFLLG